MLLNCDLGESYGHWQMAADSLVMPHIDMANIACGYHAGDPQVMQKTVNLALQHHVKIGAHPSYPDRQGFGRRSMQLRKDEIENLIIYQLGALAGICQSQNTQIEYVKPHGALYNDMMKDDAIFIAILSAMSKYDRQLPLLLLATPDNKKYQSLAQPYRVKLLFEAFADRAYDDQGMLVSRAEPDAVHQDPQRIIAQVKQLQTTASITSLYGKTIAIQADTICVHGDNAEAVKLIERLKQELEETKPTTGNHHPKNSNHS